ncbi:MAG: adenosylcobinamide-phosphate synthase CbiB [Cohaesibacter sp.]|nr:adenosylcobinamide-phosphate synthase CbiB [Cohaesibacter sp.]
MMSDFLGSIPLSLTNCSLLALIALLIDGIIGDPDWLWRRLPHPVVWFGKLISIFEARFHKPERQSAQKQRQNGIALISGLLLVAICSGLLLQALLAPLGWGGLLIGAVIASVFLAQKSLYEHVKRVWQPLSQGDLAGARMAVSMIVGRDPNQLDEAGIARASIESTAENFSDGVVAPLFWLWLFGLPGLFAYKALNTADSMIGHRTEHYLHLGSASAKLDDGANFIPSRLSMCFLLVGGWLASKCHSIAQNKAGLVQTIKHIFRDAPHHRSPSAGWPEGAMAYQLDIALSGPRIYDGTLTDDPYVNEAGRKDIGHADIKAALQILISACAVEIVLIGLIVLL